jgi:hypothetical protein
MEKKRQCLKILKNILENQIYVNEVCLLSHLEKTFFSSIFKNGISYTIFKKIINFQRDRFKIKTTVDSFKGSLGIK